MNLYDKIAKAAYELYEKSGKIGGRNLENWLEAEKMVKDAVILETPETAKEKVEKRRGQRRKI